MCVLLFVVVFRLAAIHNVLGSLPEAVTEYGTVLDASSDYIPALKGQPFPFLLKSSARRIVLSCKLIASSLTFQIIFSVNDFCLYCKVRSYRIFLMFSLKGLAETHLQQASKALEQNFDLSAVSYVNQALDVLARYSCPVFFASASYCRFSFEPGS